MSVRVTLPDAAVGDVLNDLTSARRARIVEVVPAGTDPYWIERRSRAAAGFTAEGKLLLVTADGPGARSDGMTLEAWAAFLGGLGAVEAVNLDGDNANLWIDGCSTDGSVNWPVDGGGTTHRGARGVGSGLYVF